MSQSKETQKAVVVPRTPVIAIVDDDLAIREAMEDLVRSYGYECLLFGSAEDFLDFQPRGDIDCIVVDVEMPGMNGLEMQEAINRHSPRPPTIFVTSYTDHLTKKNAIAGGASAFLGKPLNIDALMTSLETIVGLP
ncbi:response regulator transcription factor [Rhizobium laguerreae]|uniref:response regulator transcription factor n=1 Tax=Rhizobium laguerreae TaxID=1076926 RepID=UPI001FED1513|nr:response regulator [Rhizobium laguerreae]